MNARCLRNPRTPICLAALLLAACNSDPYQGVYEGIKNRNDSMKTPTERAVSTTPSYDKYKKEREQQ